VTARTHHQQAGVGAHGRADHRQRVGADQYPLLDRHRLLELGDRRREGDSRRAFLPFEDRSSDLRLPPAPGVVEWDWSGTVGCRCGGAHDHTRPARHDNREGAQNRARSTGQVVGHAECASRLGRVVVSHGDPVEPARLLRCVSAWRNRDRAR